MRIYYVIRLCMFLIGLMIVMLSVMELVFSPIMSFNYYLPSLLRNGTTNWAVTFFYCLFLIIEAFNFLAAGMLFVNIFLTGYFDRYFSYDLLTLISSTLSLSIIMHDSLMGINFYGDCVEKDIYIQVVRTGRHRCRRNRPCMETDIYRWHQSKACCGWDSPANLINVYNQNNSDYLPQFCCYNYNYMPLLKTRASTWNLPDLMSCKYDSQFKFNTTCDVYRDSFFLLRSISVFSHPATLWYTILKIILSFSFTLAKKYSLLPQSEGAFAMRIPP